MQAGLSSEPKVPVCVRANYTIFLERCFGRTWLHCDVRRWSAATKREMAKDFAVIRQMQGEPLYALNDPPGCKKHQKFMRSMGMRLDKIYECDDSTHHVFIKD